MSITFGAIGTAGDFQEFKDFSGLLTGGTIVKPTNVVAGDYVLLLVCTKQVNGSTSTFSVPSGFTQVTSANNFASDAEYRGHLNASYRKIDGSEGANFTFSWAAGSGTQTANDIYAVCIRLQGVDGTTFLGCTAASTPNDDATASPISTGITTNIANAVLVSFFSAKGTMATQDANYPSGMTGQFVRDNGGGGFSIGMAIQVITASGTATGNRTWTNVLSGSPYWGACDFAIKPAAAASILLPQLERSTRGQFRGQY